MSKSKKLTEGGGEGGGGGGGAGGGNGGEKFLNCNPITSSRCKLFCSLFVVQLIPYREFSLCWDGSIRTVALGQQSEVSSGGI